MEQRTHFTVSSLFVMAAFLAAGQQQAADPPIIFVSRAFASMPFSPDRTDAVERARSGKLMMRKSADNFVTLLEAARNIPAGVDPAMIPIDVFDPEVFYDGTKIVFTGFSAAEEAWRIFEIQYNGIGFHQVTHSDRTIDLNGELDITDSIYLILHLFNGGPEPPPPFPNCGRAPEGSLSCDQDVCP